MKKYTLRLNDNEADFFEKQVSKTALNKQTYLKNLIMNTPIKSKLDNDLVRELIKIAGDQGRIAGLLKLFILEYEINEENQLKIYDLISELNFLKDSLKKGIQQINKELIK